MTESQMKAQTTRQRNQAARAELWEEQAALKRTARLALLRVMEDENATLAEILDAAHLLTEIV